MSRHSAPPIYRIHPAIGIARLGDSPDEFCISPEVPAGLPLACDPQGNPLLSPDGKSEVPITKFKDQNGRIKRQAARFHIYVYDEKSPEGRPLNLGDPVEGGGNHGVLVDIQWRVYLANKKSSWYEFKQLDGERGYSESHPRRNADVTDAEARQKLIIDPGPQIVNVTNRRRASFDRYGDGLYAPVFPPPLNPRSIDTLGELLTSDRGHLLVLGGHGCSGTFKDGFGNPRIEDYANNDGWFDDVSDGPVMARLVMFSTEVGRQRFIDVEYPAWALVGYPAYVPQILDMVTLDDVVYNTAVTQFAYRTDVYGTSGTFDNPEKIDPNDIPALMHWKAGNLEWNPDYKPWFFRDIWTILFRADEFTYLTNVLAQSNYPHNQTQRGNFDPYKLGVPPFVNRTALKKSSVQLALDNQSGDLFIEALEPTLVLLDDQARMSLQATRTPALLMNFQGSQNPHNMRETLRSAVADFAIKVFPEAPTEDAEAYLAGWQRIYKKAKEDRKSAEAVRYREAEQTLRKTVDQVLEALRKSVGAPAAKNLDAEIPRGALLKRREEPAPQAPAAVADTRTDEPIESSFEKYLSEFRSGKLLADRLQAAAENSTYDPYRIYRMYLFELLRQSGEENDFRLLGKPNSRIHNLPLMPLLAGDNPLSNTVPSKFLRLTDYQLFLLRQWADGKFYNEVTEGWVPPVDPWRPYDNWVNQTGRDLDEGVLTNLLGGAFCPGGEVTWVIRNPSIYKDPYRLKADPNFYNFRQTAANSNQNAGVLPVPEEDYVAATGVNLSQDSNFRRGLQPGDLTKYSALPWQADFNECSTQNINVTYEDWNILNPDSEDDQWMKLEEKIWETLWWPAHRPLQTYEVAGFNSDGTPIYQYLNWSRGVPQTNAGDLKMVTEWSRLGFVIRNPYVPEDQLNAPSPNVKYISVERSQEEQ
jgi:L-Lysine epsilon oxidase N-terminal/L-lysine epsilon oxidase C-terminal domain